VGVQNDRPPSDFDHPFIKGGSGSGNYGHQGRSGERGGSAPGQPRSVAGKEFKGFPPATSPRKGKGEKVDGKKFGAKLTEAESKALSDYVNQGSSNINDHLRNGKALFPEYNDHIAAVNSAIAKGDNSERLLYRGARIQSMESPAFDYSTERRAFVQKFEDQIGKTVTMKGFQSTTTSPELAAEFAGVNDNPIFEIRAKGGAPIGDLFGAKENEVVLPHGAKYKVLDVVHNVKFNNPKYGDRRNRFTVIRLEMQ
jgi:hypothetical protein